MTDCLDSKGNRWPPVLVTCPTAAGTLAAVRVLGRAGIRVAVGGYGLINAARWSRYASEFWPHEMKMRRRVDLSSLVCWSKRSRGHVLLAASDETAWLIARHAKLLAKTFIIYSPPFSTVATIIDKKRLWHACEAAKIGTLPSFFPRSEEEMHAIASHLPYPVLMKPRSHVRATRGDNRGTVVGSAAELSAGLYTYFERERAIGNGERIMPLFQHFVAAEKIVSISGFVDRSGTRAVVHASRKIMQRSRPLGIGLAFEAIKAEPQIADAAVALCRRLGYFGVFEIEFIHFEGSWRVIDFNPRFFHQMALDIGNGAPLPLLAYLDACRNLEGLDASLEESKSKQVSQLGFSDVFSTVLTSVFRLIFNRLSPIGMLSWYWNRRGRLVDAAMDPRDPLPGIVHMVSEFQLGVSALPRLLREGRSIGRLASV